MRAPAGARRRALGGARPGAGIGVGLLAFMTSIEDSYRDRGEAVGGVSDVQVEAVGASSLPAGLAGRLDRIGGTRTRSRWPSSGSRWKPARSEWSPPRSGSTARPGACAARCSATSKLPAGRSAKPGLALSERPGRRARRAAGRKGAALRLPARRRACGSPAWSTSTRRSRTSITLPARGSSACGARPAGRPSST